MEKNMRSPTIDSLIQWRSLNTRQEVFNWYQYYCPGFNDEQINAILDIIEKNLEIYNSDPKSIDESKILVKSPMEDLLLTK